ncbi:serine-rich protein-related [Zea mays]|uniref:Serine-rich protein-related n=1 Tax=Zea mays TaxID=4577 RepID=A0A1D6IZK9_MAIZE|nr:serine-rich protein-related [Zea mays]
MARATAPSSRPPSAMAAAAAAAAATAASAAASLVPQRRATARGASSRSQPHQHRRATLPVVAPARPKRASCACSPTTHPGSFRCALHRGGQGPLPASASAALVSSRLSAPRRASMANPLVRIAAVEGGDHIRRALAALVRPTPSQTRRRADAFRPTPSRLSAMSSTAAAAP